MKLYFVPIVLGARVFVVAQAGLELCILLSWLLSGEAGSVFSHAQFSLSLRTVENVNVVFTVH